MMKASGPLITRADREAIMGVITHPPHGYNSGSELHEVETCLVKWAVEIQLSYSSTLELVACPEDRVETLASHVAVLRACNADDIPRNYLLVAADCLHLWDGAGYNSGIATAAALSIRAAASFVHDGDIAFRTSVSILHIAFLRRYLAVVECGLAAVSARTEVGPAIQTDAALIREVLLAAASACFGRGFADIQSAMGNVADLNAHVEPMRLVASGAEPSRPVAESLVVAPGLDLTGMRAERAKELSGFRALAHPLLLAGAEKSPDEVVAALEGRTPWAADLHGHLRSEMRLRRFTGQRHFQLHPMLMVGPPGSGKSALAAALAKAAGVPMERIDAGGKFDAMDLVGSAYSWSYAQPGRAVSAIMRGGCPNPILFVDEVDKVGASTRNGNIVAALLSMLEPGTARSFFDECLRTKVDISHVTWILAANDIRRVPAPLLSRCKVVRVGRPGPAHADRVIRSVAAGIARDLGVDPAHLPEIPAIVQAELVKLFRVGGGADLRRLRKALEAVVSTGIEEAQDRRLQH